MAVNVIPRAGRVGTKGAFVDIAAMLLWMVTVAAGVYLLAAGRPARPPAAPAPAAPVPATESARATQAAGVPQASGVPQAAATAYAAGAAVPPITHTRITTQPGEHPLLEFMHPALGIAGLGCWIAYVITRFSGFAWAAFGVIVVTIAAGLSWYAVNARAIKAARSSRVPGTAEPGAAQPGAAQPGTAEPGTAQPGTAAASVRAPARRYPARRLLVHGSGAAVTLVLALVTVLAAHHA
jgi:hypothetical protein